jgi:hypothetical protein
LTEPLPFIQDCLNSPQAMDNRTFTRQELAISFINETDQHLFITGKAGTGKTTLLREIKAKTRKKLVIAAPTGVAAINAGGVTLHSLFKLPTELILPVMDRTLPFKTTGTVLADLSLTAEKEKLLLDLEVLVIDEVSMMRADVLDAIDHVLRHVRGNPDPFGGVQVIYFGDLYQLPPVAKPEEEAELLKYYRSFFFFDAKVMAAAAPVYIELTEVFRQSDPAFLKLLNNIRNNEPDAEDLALLTSKHQPDFQPAPGEHFVRLTSHRRIAESTNREELEKLPGEAVVYQASSSGIVDLKSLPVEQELNLKLGAQVMFVRNDLRGDKRYFNGKIGVVAALSPNHIEVTFPDGQSLQVEQERWDFIKYRQQENDQFSEASAGEFRQYPLRLAWAITIHKSQGLTFEQAIIDAGSAFAAGQVYVALSRVRTLEGVVLFTAIRRENLFSNTQVVAFAQRMAAAAAPEMVFELERRKAVFVQIRATFRFFTLLRQLQRLPSSVDKFRYSLHSSYLQLAAALLPDIGNLGEVSEKFIRQLDQYWYDAEKQPKGYARLTEAAAYFAAELSAKFITPLKTQLADMLIKRAPKELIRFYSGLEKMASSQIVLMKQCPEIWQAILDGAEPAILRLKFKAEESVEIGSPIGKIIPTSAFTTTQKTTLKIFREGATISDIAVQRNMTLATIEGHIILFVESGQVHIDDLLLKEKADLIRSALKDEAKGIHEIKKKLGETVSYFEVRAFIAYLKSMSGENKTQPGTLF